MFEKIKQSAFMERGKIWIGCRITRVATRLLSYYAVSLILVPLVKGWISGPAGTFISCFLQVFYIVFIFPLVMTQKDKS